MRKIKKLRMFEKFSELREVEKGNFCISYITRFADIQYI